MGTADSMKLFRWDNVHMSKFFSFFPEKVMFNQISHLFIPVISAGSKMGGRGRLTGMWRLMTCYSTLRTVHSQYMVIHRLNLFSLDPAPGPGQVMVFMCMCLFLCLSVCPSPVIPPIILNLTHNSKVHL